MTLEQRTTSTVQSSVSVRKYEHSSLPCSVRTVFEDTSEYPDSVSNVCTVSMSDTPGRRVSKEAALEADDFTTEDGTGGMGGNMGMRQDANDLMAPFLGAEGGAPHVGTSC